MTPSPLVDYVRTYGDVVTKQSFATKVVEFVSRPVFLNNACNTKVCM